MNGIGIASCIGLFAFVLLIEIGVQWLDARTSGWGRLARRYPADATPQFKPLPAEVWVNLHHYTASPTVAMRSAGIRLAMGPPLSRLCHPPVFIPWDDLTPLSQITSDGALPLRVGESATITLTGSTACVAARLLFPSSRRSRRPRRRG